MGDVEREGAGGRALAVAAEGRAVQPFRHRHDGWTAARQAQFVACLTETGCVRAACEQVGLSKTSAYRAYARMPEFAGRWERALMVRRPMLEDAAFERAVNGVTVPVTRKGRVVGERRRYSDALLRYLIERGDRRRVAMAYRIGRTHGGQAADADADEAPRERATRGEMDASLLRQLLPQAVEPEDDPDDDDAAED